MNFGKTLFAQLMEFVPWTSFARIVAWRGGDSGVRNLSCTEQFRAMAFAQLTYRESLRDIEACLLANQTKLYSMGFRAPVKRSTLADANEARDWRIWEDLATLLIRRARKLYCNDSFGVDLTNTVYALDATTIDLCLSLFPWAPFRTNKAAVRLHTLLDLRGNIPAFIHIRDGKTHEVNVLDILSFEAGAFYVMDRGYLDFSRLFTLHQSGAFFVTRAKRGMNAHRVYSMKVDRSTGNSENAVKTQIGCAVATYVLIAIVKKEIQIDASLYTLLQILSVSVFEKNQLHQALQGIAYIPEQSNSANQLNLFNF